MKEKKLEPGTLHYLPGLSPNLQEETEVSRVIKELSERLLGLEKEIQQSLSQLQSDLVQSNLRGQNSQANSNVTKDIQELKKEFEFKIEAIARTLAKIGHSRSSKPRSFLSKIKKIISWSPLYRMIKSDGVSKSFQAILNEPIDPFGRDPAFEQKIKPLFDFLYYRYWRVSTEGLENIPSKSRALLVSNHSGTLPYDGSMIRLAVSNDHPSGRDVRFLVEDFVYYLPFLGTYMYRLGGVRASRDNAEQLLNTNHLVAVFPEGVKGIGKRYSKRYHLQRFGRGGFIKLAIQTSSPIIPVAVIGAEEIHPILYKSSLLAKPLGIPYVPITPTLPWLGLLGLIPLPSKWFIHFGEAIDFSAYDKKILEDELQIHRLSEMVRQKIQTMVSKALKKRRSVWWG